MSKEIVYKKDVLDLLSVMPSEEVTRALLIQSVKQLPSEQPEKKPIGYRDCANAMLRMWMDNVVTDGEYNRIMDRLNAFWEMSKDGN